METPSHDEFSPLESLSSKGNAAEHDGDGFVQSLARGFSVVRAFGPNRSELTIAEVARICGLTRAGARRILLTLETLGYVNVEGRHFSLTARILDLGRGFQAQPVWEAARPVLGAIASKLNETASAGVLEGWDVRYTLRTRSSRVLHWDIKPGDHLPAYASSMGRVLLAALEPASLDRYFREAELTKLTRYTVDNPDVLRARLDEVRRQGWSCVCGEVEEGITGVAVPLVHPNGQTIAALQVHLATERASPQMVEETILPQLQEGAKAIARML